MSHKQNLLKAAIEFSRLTTCPSIPTIHCSMAAIEPKLLSLKKLRDDQEKLYQTINNINSKLSRMSIQQAEKLDNKFWKRLRALNEKGRVLADKEATLCSELEGLITERLEAMPKENSEDASENESRTSEQVANPEVVTDPLSPFSNKISVGDEVAAKVFSPGDGSDVWIVVRVMKVTAVDEALLFHVRDEVPDDVNGKKKSTLREYVLPQTCILPFEPRANGKDGPLFVPGSRVLAIYPGTSTLYKATVVGSETEESSGVHFLLEFDDDEILEEGVEKLPVLKVSFDGIVPLPEGHRQ